MTASNGLSVTYSNDRTGRIPLGGDTLQTVDCTYTHAKPPPAEFFNLTGLLHVPKTGDYEFRLSGSPSAAAYIDGQQALVSAPGAMVGDGIKKLRLEEGCHLIVIRAEMERKYGGHLHFFWTPPGGQEELVPASALYHAPVKHEEDRSAKK